MAGTTTRPVIFLRYLRANAPARSGKTPRQSLRSGKPQHRRRAKKPNKARKYGSPKSEGQTQQPERKGASDFYHLNGTFLVRGFSGSIARTKPVCQAPAHRGHLHGNCTKLPAFPEILHGICTSAINPTRAMMIAHRQITGYSERQLFTIWASAPRS
jgi:hypothetical protein